MTVRKIALHAAVLNSKKAGVGNYAFYLIKALQQKAVDFKMDVYLDSSARGLFEDSKNMRFFGIGPFKNSWERVSWEQLQSPFQYARQKYDLIHFMDYQTPFIPVKTPHIVTIHDLCYHRYPQYFSTGSRWLKRLNTPRSIHRASAIITVSDFSRRELAELFPETVKKRIYVVNPGLKDSGSQPSDAVDERTVLARYGIQGSYVLYVGTLEPRKNITSLVRSMAALWNVGKLTSTHLVLAGGKGWIYENIFQTIHELGVSDKVVHTGYVNESDLPIVYRHAQAFVYPSYYEGFGMPPLEAMAQGTPVITSDQASLPEAVGDAALLVPPSDEGQLSHAIERVCTETDLRMELIGRGNKRAAMFTWSKAAEKVLGIYEETLRGI